MKYYCIGNPIEVFKLKPSDSIIDNLPFVGTPLYGKIKITDEIMRSAYENSESLFICKNLDTARALRNAKIITEKAPATPEFFQRSIKKGYIPGDFAIYEVDVVDNIEDNFVSLKDFSQDDLNIALSSVLASEATNGNRTNIPDIQVYQANKLDLNITLISCSYFPLDTSEEEDFDVRNACCVL